MATDPTAAEAAPRFCELVLEGPSDAARAFLRGLVLGAGEDGILEFTLDHTAATHALGERVRGAIGFHPHCHAIVDERTRARLAATGEPSLAASGLRLVAQRGIRGASCAFRYEAFARRYAQEIRALLATLPAGLRLEGGAGTETVDPAAHGIEVYTAAHEYEIRGEGTVRGRVDLVIAARRHLLAHPLVRVESLALDLA